MAILATGRSSRRTVYYCLHWLFYFNVGWGTHNNFVVATFAVGRPSRRMS